MAENLQPESMSTWMRSVEKRLSAIERPKAVGSSAVQDIQVFPLRTPSWTLTAWGDYVEVSAGTWTTTWLVSIPVVVGDAVVVQMPITVRSAGAAADIRLRSVVNSQTTDAKAVSPGDAYIKFRWAVPDMDEYVDTNPLLPYQIVVEAQYTAGVDEIVMYRPFSIVHGSSVDLDATADGNPEVL